MKLITLNTQDQMPALGLGTWKAEEEELYDAIRHAIQVGYRHIDCAVIYLNQETLGRALSDAINAGDVTREELWITSKLWNTRHEPEAVLPALQETLDQLQLDYLDLYLVHWPVVMKHHLGHGRFTSADDFIALDKLPLEVTWEAMEALKAEGKVRNIGLSNCSATKIEKLLKTASIVPAVNQVECHPYFQQQALLEFCMANNIHITGYAPLGSYDRPKLIKQKAEPRVLDNKVVNQLVKQHDATPAQIVLAWAMQRGVSVIPKSANAGRIAENFAACSVDLSDKDMQKMASLDLNFRFITGSFYTMAGSPYTLENLWD